VPFLEVTSDEKPNCYIVVRDHGALRCTRRFGTVGAVLLRNIWEEIERVITDESAVYLYSISQNLLGKHETINHSREYVVGDVYTNTIESAFSLLKRGIMGSFRRISIKHLHRNVSEFEYRFNRRQSPNRFEETLERMARAKPMPFVVKRTQAAVIPRTETVQWVKR